MNTKQMLHRSFLKCHIMDRLGARTRTQHPVSEKEERSKGQYHNTSLQKLISVELLKFNDRQSASKKTPKQRQRSDPRSSA